MNIPAPRKDERKSDLVKAIEARPRPSKILPVNMAVSILEGPIHKIAFRVNTKGEDKDAVDRAHKYVNDTVQTDSARQDPDILTDSKLIAALWHACREVKTTYVKDELGTDVPQDEETIYPAFPSPQWMHEHLTTDQIAVLVNMLNAVRADLSPLKAFDRDAADTILNVLADVPDEGVPAAILSEFSREGLTSLVVYAARCLGGARSALAEQEGAPGHLLVDVEHAALAYASAERLKDRAQYGEGLRDAVRVLRGEMLASALVPEAPE